jgi:hypothetical protein
MMAARQRENVHIPGTCGIDDTDRPPWESDSTLKITDWIDAPGNNETPWGYLEERNDDGESNE